MNKIVNNDPEFLKAKEYLENQVKVLIRETESLTERFPLPKGYKYNFDHEGNLIMYCAAP